MRVVRASDSCFGIGRRRACECRDGSCGQGAVNLNFTAGPQNMAYARREGGIKTILTSRRFLSKADIAEMPGMGSLLEGRAETFSTAQKVRLLIAARALPTWALMRFVRAPLAAGPCRRDYLLQRQHRHAEGHSTHAQKRAGQRPFRAQVFDMRRTT
jgi:hypothetical protein